MSDEQRPLEEKFMDVDGVGEATTEELLDIVNGHRFTYPAYIKKARKAAEQGDDRKAAIYLRRAGKD